MACSIPSFGSWDPKAEATAAAAAAPAAPIDPLGQAARFNHWQEHQHAQPPGMREALRRLALGSMLNPRLVAGSPGLVLKSRRPDSRGGSRTLATPLPANVAAAVSRMMPEVSLPSYAPPAYY